VNNLTFNVYLHSCCDYIISYTMMTSLHSMYTYKISVGARLEMRSVAKTTFHRLETG